MKDPIDEARQDNIIVIQPCHLVGREDEVLAKWLRIDWTKSSYFLVRWLRGMSSFILKRESSVIWEGIDLPLCTVFGIRVRLVVQTFIVLTHFKTNVYFKLLKDRCIYFLLFYLIRTLVLRGRKRGKQRRGKEWDCLRKTVVKNKLNKNFGRRNYWSKLSKTERFRQRRIWKEGGTW